RQGGDRDLARALPYPSSLWGGWSSAARPGGGVWDHSAPGVWRWLSPLTPPPDRFAVTLPTKGRDGEGDGTELHAPPERSSQRADVQPRAGHHHVGRQPGALGGDVGALARGPFALPERDHVGAVTGDDAVHAGLQRALHPDRQVVERPQLPAQAEEALDQ